MVDVILEAAAELVGEGLLELLFCIPGWALEEVGAKERHRPPPVLATQLAMSSDDLHVSLRALQARIKTLESRHQKLGP